MWLAKSTRFTIVAFKIASVATYTVRGAAQREVRPERAKALLGVEATGAHRGEVWEQAQQAHQHLTSQAAELVATGQAADWTAQEIQVGTYQEWVPLAGNPGQSEPVRRFRASGDVAVEFTDFTALSRWLATVAEIPNVEVRGVSWSLTTATRVRLLREIRHEAVQDAIQRARDYAADFGQPELTLSAVYEPGLYPGPDSSGGIANPVMPRALMMADSSAAMPSVELKPATISLTAEIIAVFTSA